MDITGLNTALSRPETGAASVPDDAARREAAMREAAVSFETVFLAQMLDFAGVGKTPEAFGGGIGEDTFRSFLVQEHARLIAEKGGIGLAESIYQSLARTVGDDG